MPTPGTKLPEYDDHEERVKLFERLSSLSPRSQNQEVLDALRELRDEVRQLRLALNQPESQIITGKDAVRMFWKLQPEKEQS